MVPFTGTSTYSTKWSFISSNNHPNALLKNKKGGRELIRKDIQSIVIQNRIGHDRPLPQGLSLQDKMYCHKPHMQTTPPPPPPRKIPLFLFSSPPQPQFINISFILLFHHSLPSPLLFNPPQTYTCTLHLLYYYPAPIAQDHRFLFQLNYKK